jgi:hypothetical protein
MNKRQTMIASIAAVTVVGAMLLLSGLFGKAIALNPNGNPDYTVTPQGLLGDLNGQVTKIVVEIDSPFGFERITSFKVFQTDNMIRKDGYYTLRLMGPIMNDKITLLHWISRDIGKLPDGMYTQLPITTGGGKPAIMTKPKEGATINVLPMAGKVTLFLLESYQDVYSPVNQGVRKFEFSGCHVAGYNLGAMYDDEKSFFRDGLQYFEEVVFACSGIRDLKSQSSNSVRGFMVERAINNDDRQITNEKGELIITSREYRQPIVLESKQQVEKELKSTKQEIIARTELDKTYYKIGDAATFTVTFTDIEGNAIDPDTIKAVYDGRTIQLEKHDAGIYTFTTPPLLKAHHQLIVSVEKNGFPTDTSYMSIPIHRIS